MGLLLGIGIAVGAVALGSSGSKPDDTTASAELPYLWRVPPFFFHDQAGRPVTRDGLEGKPYIANFVFTECTSACPLMTSRMVMLQKKLADVDIAFVSFSVDPAHDTPAALERYRGQWNDTETRWTLVSTTEKKLPHLAAGFQVENERSDDPNNPIIHSDAFFLIDKDNYIRGTYASTERESMEQLRKDARKLAMPLPPEQLAATDADPDALSKAPAHAVAPSGSPAAVPGALYASLGCAGCHDNPRIAPPLVNLIGQKRVVEGGELVVVDRAYIQRAIEDPAAELVPGYPAEMPSYASMLDASQLEALVTEIAERRVEGVAAAPQDVELVVDPVCDMKVRAVPEAPHVHHEGTDYYFCAHSCAVAFEKDPSSFL